MDLAFDEFEFDPPLLTGLSMRMSMSIRININIILGLSINGFALNIVILKL